jgi:hypothetical protein
MLLQTDARHSHDSLEMWRPICVEWWHRSWDLVKNPFRINEYYMTVERDKVNQVSQWTRDRHRRMVASDPPYSYEVWRLKRTFVCPISYPRGESVRLFVDGNQKPKTTELYNHHLHSFILNGIVFNFTQLLLTCKSIQPQIILKSHF